MTGKRSYEIVYQPFHKRWAFKPQGLPGALQVARTRDAVLRVAIPICGNQPCTLRIYTAEGKLEEERAFGKDASG
jgi:hypothetical protein